VSKVLLVGEVLAHRSFNGANKALPVLASSLHNAGFDSVQLNLERPDVTIDDVLREARDASLVAFAGCMTPQWPELDVNCRKVADLLARNNSNTPLVVGGYATKAVTDIAERAPWITAFFDGEGEDAVVDVARWAERGGDRAELPDIAGMCHLRPDGTFHRSVAHRVRNINHIDQQFGFVHVPGVHDMDILVDKDGRQLRTAQLFTQRGCPWACSFCNKSMESNNVVRLSEESLRLQLADLRSHGFEAVYLDVDTFAVNRAAADMEMRVLREEGFHWGSNTRIDTADRDLLEAMVDHRCVYMFFGVEHTNPGVLLAVNKFNGPLRAQLRKIEAYHEQVVRVFRDMSEVGLPSSYFLILGLPKAVVSEDRTMVLRYEPTSFEDDLGAIEFGLDRCEPDYLNFNMLRFMPGSAAADVPNHPAYSCVRPSRDKPITAGYFLPRVATGQNYHVPENHGVYRLCESVGRNQPTTTAVDAQRVYDSIRVTVEMINARIDAGRKPTKLFVDNEIKSAGLLTQDTAGHYRLAPLTAFEGL
jgi:anaerobic magnesium-protoporphyrin IX monomethyl ester cyclase